MVLHLFGIETRVARTESQGFDDGTQIGLRGQAGHGVDGAVDRIDAGLDCGKHAGRRDPARVMRVEVNRQTHLLLERLDQRRRGARLTQPAHVLDREHVGTHGLELLGRS